MSEERDLILYYLKIHFSTLSEFELMDEQHDNINQMKRVVELNPNLTPEERNILNVAYKNPVSSRRKTIAELLNYIQVEQLDKLHPQRVARLINFREQVAQELRDICFDLINLIDQHLIPSSNEAEERVYYAKMKGDYYRYICETYDDKSDIESIIQKAHDCYQTGLDIAKAELPQTNPTFLGLVLNYSVFLYDIMDHKDEAIELSSTTYSDTVDLIDASINDDTYKEASIILDLLRTNQANWVKGRENE